MARVAKQLKRKREKKNAKPVASVETAKPHRFGFFNVENIRIVRPNASW